MSHEITTKFGNPTFPMSQGIRYLHTLEWHLHTRIADHQSSKASCFHDVLGNVSLSRLGSQILVVTDRSKRLSGLQMFSLKIVKNTCLYNNGSHVVNPVPIFWQMVSDMWRLAAFNPNQETELQTDPLNLPSLSSCAANLMFLSCPSGKSTEAPKRPPFSHDEVRPSNSKGEIAKTWTKLNPMARFFSGIRIDKGF